MNFIKNIVDNYLKENYPNGDYQEDMNEGILISNDIDFPFFVKDNLCCTYELIEELEVINNQCFVFGLLFSFERLKIEEIESYNIMNLTQIQFIGKQHKMYSRVGKFFEKVKDFEE